MWLVFLASLLATFGWWWHSQTRAANRAQSNFANRVEEAESVVSERLDDYEQLILGARGLFRAVPEVSASQWRHYVESQHLAERYPGIRGLAFARYITGSGKKQLIGKMRSTGEPHFTITPPGRRDEYAPLIFGSGVTARFGRFIGLDQLADPGRSKAARLAMDSGTLVATGRVLLPASGHGPAENRVLVFAPVYRRGTHPLTPEQRRADILGFIVCPISVPELMKDAFRAHNRDLDLEIFDGPRISRNTQLFDADLAERMFGQGFQSEFISRASLSVFGRDWLLVFSSLPPFEASVEAEHPTFVLVFGVLASLLLLALTWSLSRTRTQALQLAGQMSAAYREREHQYRSLMEQASDAILVADCDGRYIDVNVTACELLGYTRAELLGLHVDNLLATNGAAEGPSCLVTLGVGESTIRERHLRHKNGTLIPVEISAKILDDGRLQEFVRDISERLRAEEHARLAAAVFESASEGIVITDSQNRIVTVNPAFSRITEYSKSEVLGNDPKILQSGQHAPEFYVDMWKKLEKEGAWRGEIANRRKGGEVYTEWLSINRIDDPEGRVANYVAIISDITERKVTEAHIQHLAHHDSLTDLPNRSLLLDRLEQSIKRARRDDLLLAVLFIDLDRFKLINDKCGHKTGDIVLQHVAKTLLAGVRESDTVARIGGDEFVLLMPDISDPTMVEAIAEKVQARLNEPFEAQGQQLVVGASIGIAVYPSDGADADALLSAADAAMYQAKRERRSSNQ